jgi:hypothetical protein
VGFVQWNELVVTSLRQILLVPLLLLLLYFHNLINLQGGGECNKNGEGKNEKIRKQSK